MVVGYPLWRFHNDWFVLILGLLLPPFCLVLHCLLCCSYIYLFMFAYSKLTKHNLIPFKSKTKIWTKIDDDNCFTWEIIHYIVGKYLTPLTVFHRLSNRLWIALCCSLICTHERLSVCRMLNLWALYLTIFCLVSLISLHCNYQNIMCSSVIIIVVIGRSTGRARLSVCLSVSPSVSKTTKSRRSKICANVLQGRSISYANFQLEESKFTVKIKVVYNAVYS